MPNINQSNRLLQIETPLGPDVLLLSGLSGREEMSRLFRYDLELLSEKTDITAKDLLGQKVTCTVRVAGEPIRYVHGIVSRFAAGPMMPRGLRRYRAEIVPWLWLLTRTSDCRAFQNLGALEVIEKVFKSLGFSDYEQGEVRGSYPRWEFCVQYRESAFDIVSRLMEQVGIYYWFRHEEGRHVLVLADHKAAPKDCDEAEVVCTGGTRAGGIVSSWERSQSFRTGKWTQTDYNFETPSTNLLTNTKTILKVEGFDKFEWFDWPAGYKQADAQLTRVRMEEEEAGFDVASGASSCLSFFTGGKFKFKEHPVQDEVGQAYVITSLQLSASDDSVLSGSSGQQEASNSFTCMPADVVFRPARTTPRPTIRGPQPAVVVGPDGEEISTDKYGRIQVRFPWDRENSASCWVRVAQGMAGDGFGAVLLPRIGHEVLVAFYEGDPDRPVVVGSVYNANKMPPYGLPGSCNVSVFRTRSTKGGDAETCNELSFDDTKGSEVVLLHAEKNQTTEVEHDKNLTVGNDRTADVGNNDTLTVTKDRSATVGGNETLQVDGNQKATVDKDQTITIGGNQTESVTKNRKVEIDGTDTLQVQKDLTETVDGKWKVTVKSDIAISTSEGGLTVSAKKAASLTAKTVTIEADDTLTLKCGSATIEMKKSGDITIDGKKIQIKGSGDVIVKGSKVALN
jgi:type VI secretion system secreted protein VgrG